MKNNLLQNNIPKGWQEKKLGEVCDIFNGSTPKRSVSEYWENGNIPWFTVDDIRRDGRIINQTNQYITEKALKETSVKLLPIDSVLLCCTASIGEVAFAKIPLTTNQQFNGLVSKDTKVLFPYYLFYSTQKLGENIKSKSGKTTINFLSVGSLSKEKVLIPPIKEQQKIAEILEVVDRDIIKTQEIITTTEKLKSGLMQQLFTRGIGHMKFKETKIGQIPDVWTVGTLDQLKETGSNISYGVVQPGPEIVNGILFVRGGDIKNGRVSSNLRTISPEISNQYSRTILKGGELLVSLVGYPGECTVVPNEFIGANIARQVGLIRLDKNINTFFVQQYLSSPFGKANLLGNLVGSAQQVINLNMLRKVLIPLPPQPEQQNIAEILSSVDEKILVNKKLKEKLTQLKKGLMSDLLSGKVRVN